MGVADKAQEADIAIAKALEYTFGTDSSITNYHSIAEDLYRIAYLLAVQTYHYAKLADNLDKIIKYKKLVILAQLHHVMHHNHIRPDSRTEL